VAHNLLRVYFLRNGVSRDLYIEYLKEVIEGLFEGGIEQRPEEGTEVEVQVARHGPTVQES
jgi:hypothetical protein